MSDLTGIDDPERQGNGAGGPALPPPAGEAGEKGSGRPPGSAQGNLAPSSECCGAAVDLLASVPLCVRCNGMLVAPRTTGGRYEVFPGRHVPGHNERCGLPPSARDLVAVIDAMLAEIPETEEFLRLSLKQEREIAARFAERDLSQRNNLLKVAEILVAVVGGLGEPWYDRVMAIWSGDAERVNVYGMEPRGIPTISHLVAGVGAVICASGKEAVDRHVREGCPLAPAVASGAVHVHGPDCASDGWTADPGDERPMDAEMAKVIYGGDAPESTKCATCGKAMWSGYDPPLGPDTNCGGDCYECQSKFEAEAEAACEVLDMVAAAQKSPTGDAPRLEVGERVHVPASVITDVGHEEKSVTFEAESITPTLCADCGGQPDLILLAQDCAKCVRCFINAALNARCFQCKTNPTEAIVRAIGPDGKDDTVGTCVDCLLKHVSSGRN